MEVLPPCFLKNRRPDQAKKRFRGGPEGASSFRAVAQPNRSAGASWIRAMSVARPRTSIPSAH